MPDVDVECAALGELVKLLNALPDDESRRRALAYGQSRCIKPPAPGPDYSMAKQMAYASNQGIGPK